MILCFFNWNLYLKTNGVRDDIIFLLRKPKEDSIKNVFVIFLGKFPNCDIIQRTTGSCRYVPAFCLMRT